MSEATVRDPWHSARLATREWRFCSCADGLHDRVHHLNTEALNAYATHLAAAIEALRLANVVVEASLLSDEEFAEVWTALGTVVRARGRQVRFDEWLDNFMATSKDREEDRAEQRQRRKELLANVRPMAQEGARGMSEATVHNYRASKDPDKLTPFEKVSLERDGLESRLAAATEALRQLVAGLLSTAHFQDEMGDCIGGCSHDWSGKGVHSKKGYISSYKHTENCVNIGGADGDEEWHDKDCIYVAASAAYEQAMGGRWGSDLRS